jgi:hypothetical protein
MMATCQSKNHVILIKIDFITNNHSLGQFFDPGTISLILEVRHQYKAEVGYANHT